MKCEPRLLTEGEPTAVARARRKLDDVCQYPGWQRCPDLTWDRYTTPGKHGAPCTGYVVNRPPDSPAVSGRLVCDSCPKADTLAYRGVEGAPCSGFWWRTGEPLEGTLQMCED